MLLPIKPVCKRNKVRKDGTSLIFIQYCYTSDKRTLLNTEIAIPPACWNKKSGRISNDLPAAFGEAENLNADLLKYIRKAEDIVTFALNNGICNVLDFLRDYFDREFNPAELLAKKADPKTLDLDLYSQLDSYIKSKTDKVVPGMLKVYKNLRDRLLAYDKYVGKVTTFESFDFNYYEGFVDFLTYKYVQRRRKKIFKGLRINSVGTTIKQLRVFLNDRMKRKIIPHIDLSDFKILTEEADAIYLTIDEIEKVYAADLSTRPYLKEIRDMFVLGCQTGLRFSDFSTIRPEDIRGGMLYKKQNKSDHWVVIPLRKEAEQILINNFNRVIPNTCNTLFNRYIKEIGELAGICEPIRFSYKRGNKDIEIVKPKFGWITSHTCRRSFCTNEFLAGTPVELIMKISGHKSVKDFYKYIKITPEQAGMQIKEIWQRRGQM